MSCFVDSGVWIAAFNSKDYYHKKAKRIVDAIVQEELKIVCISDYIFDEVLTYVRRKMGAGESINVANAMLDSPHVRIIKIDEATFQASFHIFQMYDKLSFTDSTTVVLMKNLKIECLFSFDSGFDGIKNIFRLEELPT